jgi:hypothetical protein
MTYHAERANSDYQRRYDERPHIWDTEIVERRVGHPPRVVCVCTWADAQRIAAALEAAGMIVV